MVGWLVGSYLIGFRGWRVLCGYDRFEVLRYKDLNLCVYWSVTKWLKPDLFVMYFNIFISLLTVYSPGL